MSALLLLIQHYNYSPFEIIAHFKWCGCPVARHLDMDHCFMRCGSSGSHPSDCLVSPLLQVSPKISR